MKPFKVESPGFYQILEETITAALAPLQYPNGKALGEMTARYNAEFGGTFDTPESFTPDKRYILVHALGSSFSAAGKGSVFEPDQTARLMVYVGSHSAQGRLNKDETFTALEAVEDFLNGYRVKYQGAELCQLVLEADNPEFFIPNHICYSITFKLVTKRTVGKTNY